MKLKGPNEKIDGTRKVPDGIERKGEGRGLQLDSLYRPQAKQQEGDSFA